MAALTIKHREATLSFAQAAERVRRFCAELGPVDEVQQLGLLEARGRVLAAPVLADRDQPPFHRSTRDGFACRAEMAAAWMRIVGVLKAGESWRGPALGAGETLEIMTGAPLPDGADCVVMIEHVERDQAAGCVRLLVGREIVAGENVVSAGAEAQADTVLLQDGSRLGPAQIAAAAAVGAAQLRVYRRPRVAILATGDELVGIGQTPLTHQIRNSNSYVLAAMVEALGGEPLITSPVPDTRSDLERAVTASVSDGPMACDLLLITGGVSMGKYDLVEDALAALGAEFFFTGVRMQPGKPVVFGRVPRTGNEASAVPWFGLPGNPVSTMVTFSLFAAPVLAGLGGESGYTPRFAQARLRSAVQGKPSLRRFLPALMHADGEQAQVEPIVWQGSGDLAATATANCLLVVPEDAMLEKDAGVQVLML